MSDFVTHYNNIRLHSSIGYIAPVDKLNGKAEEIFNARDKKLEAARAARKLQREAQMPHSVAVYNCSVTNLAESP